MLTPAWLSSRSAMKMSLVTSGAKPIDGSSSNRSFGLDSTNPNPID